MSWWRGTRLVIGRELLVRVRTKSFLISTFALLIVFGVIMGLPHLIGQSKYKIAVTAQTQALGADIDRAADLGKVTVDLRIYPDETSARQAVLDGKVTAAVLQGGSSVVVKKKVPDGLAPFVTSVLTADLQSAALKKQGVDLEALAAQVPKITAVEPESGDAQQKRIEAFFVMALLVSQVSIFSASVAQGIVEEKASRVIEVLVATVRPAQLLVGKVLGIGMASLLQLVSLAVIGLSVASGAGIVHLDSTDFGVITQVIPWFLIFYVFSATLNSAAAATVSRQEDLQSALGPMQLLTFAPIIIGQFGITDAERPLVEVLSYVPPFSPVLMAERWAGGLVGWEQVALSMGIMGLVTAVVAVFASRIYLQRILYFGSKISLLKALRSGSGE